MDGFAKKLADKMACARANAGEIPAFKNRGQWRIKRAEFDKRIGARPRGAGADRNGG